MKEHPKSISIPSKASSAPVNLALDTIHSCKQALIFVNTKRSAEKQAEDIAKKVQESKTKLHDISQKALKALSKPTKQCRRLAACLKKGIAFHHAGLAQAQRQLIEENFRTGLIQVISCTPTLAAGLDLPAFRSIIRDLKRYGMRGMQHIPVLEYHQMSGRAGRPKYDKWGESICIAETDSQAELITEKYIKGEPEEIYSKLAVEPVFRTYLLSLISSNLVNDRDSIHDFFGGTFWAHQFKDLPRLKSITNKVLGQLASWNFLTISDEPDADSGFVDAHQISKGRIKATLLGRRVSELYLDPLSANHLITCIKRTTTIPLTPFGLLQSVCHTLEMRPLLRTKTKEFDTIQEFLVNHEDSLLDLEPSLYDPEYETFLNSVKTARFMFDWINEKDEEYLLEKYDIRPGEIRIKLQNADWLLYSIEELTKIIRHMKPISEIKKLRFRLKHGAREELLPLLKLKQVGRVRARKLFRNKMHTIRDLKNTPESTLIGILGKATASNIIKQIK